MVASQEAVPWAPFVEPVTERESLSRSVSFGRTSTWPAVSSAVERESSTATGASLPGSTVTVTVPVSDLPRPSETV